MPSDGGEMSGLTDWLSLAVAGAALLVALLAVCLSWKANGIAKKANGIAKNANDLSEDANRTSERANTISEKAARSAADSESRQSERRDGLRAQLAEFDKTLTNRIQFAGRALDGLSMLDPSEERTLREAGDAVSHMRGFLEFNPMSAGEPWPEEGDLLNRAHGLSDAAARKECEAALRSAYALKRQCKKLAAGSRHDPRRLDHLSNQGAPPVELDAFERFDRARASISDLNKELADLQSRIQSVYSEFNRVDRGEFK